MDIYSENIQNFIKFILITRNLQNTIKQLKIKQYHTQTSKPKIRKNLKKPQVNKNFRSITEILFTPQFLALSKTRV